MCERVVVNKTRWQVMGYKALVLLVGEAWVAPPAGSRLAEVLRALQQVGGHVKVKLLPSSDDLNTAAVAQVARLYACLVGGIGDDEYLLTTDADLIPLDVQHFSTDRNDEREIRLYNAMCCAPLELPEGGIEAATRNIAQVKLGASDVMRGVGVHGDHRLLHLPISYAGASARVWRELMALSRQDEDGLVEGGVERGDLLRLAVEARLVHELGSERAHMNLADNHRHADMDMWHLDQRLLSAKVAAWRGFPELTEMIVRYGHRDRVDRMHWSVPSSLNGYIDAHLPQPGFSPDNWAVTRPLFELVLRPLAKAAEIMTWVDSYHTAFVQAHNNDY